MYITLYTARAYCQYLRSAAAADQHQSQILAVIVARQNNSPAGTPYLMGTPKKENQCVAPGLQLIHREMGSAGFEPATNRL